MYCAANGRPASAAADSILHMLQAGVFGVEVFAEVERIGVLRNPVAAEK